MREHQHYVTALYEGAPVLCEGAPVLYEGAPALYEGAPALYEEALALGWLRKTKVVQSFSANILCEGHIYKDSRNTIF